MSFLIPLVERILKADEPNKKGHVRSIVVAPTKELATQIYDVLMGLLNFHPPSASILKQMNEPEADSEDEEMRDADELVVLPGPYVVPQLLVGGRAKLSEDIASFSKINPNIVVGTPRRIVEVLQSSKVMLKRHYFDLLVLDEADRLLDINFQPDLQKILEIVPKERRTGLFSASVSEAVNELVRVGMRYPFKISAKVRSKSGALDKRTPESLRLYSLITKPTMKIPHLKKILKDNQVYKSIIYVSTRAGVDYWNHVLPTLLGLAVFPLHGDHKSAIRTKNLRRFCDATTPAILLTTDVLARGIDIPDIDLVVQLDPPSQPKDFIHRCGRSGRAGKRGMAVTFLNEGSEDDYVRYLELQGTKLEPYPTTAIISEDEISATIRDIRAALTVKREWHDRSQKAFVSWVQAYTKTLPADIFNVRKIDWPEVGKSWGLLRWPKMPELKKFYPEAREDRSLNLNLPADFDINSVAYVDKAKEARRQEILNAFARGEKPNLPTNKGGAGADAKRRKESAWSSQKEAKAVKEARREKKDVRRKADMKAHMSEADKARERELEELIAKVRAKNEAEEADSFEGFD